MKTKRFLCLLLSITIIALIIRAIICVQLFNAPDVQTPNVQTDMATYLTMAKDILKGNWPDHYDYQPFYYTVFLPFCLSIVSSSTALVMVMQTLLGSLAVWLVGLGTAQLYGRKAGLIAAVLLALARFHAFYTPFLLFEVLNSFWLALLFWLLVRSWKRNTWLLWMLSAVVLSCAALTRGNALLFLPCDHRHLLFTATAVQHRELPIHGPLVRPFDGGRQSARVGQHAGSASRRARIPDDLP